MYIVFRLINNLIGNKKYEIRSDFNGNFKLSDIHKTFMSMGFNDIELAELKFIIDSRIATDLTKEYYVADYEEKIIIIIINNNNRIIFNKICELFIKYGIEINPQQPQQRHQLPQQPHQRHQLPQQPQQQSQQSSNIANTLKEMDIDKDIINPLTEIKSEDELKITPEIINNMNQKTIKLFLDDDFKHLLRIYMKKPDLYNILSLYVQKSDIVDKFVSDFSDLEDRLLNDDETISYNELIKLLQSSNLTIPDNMLKKYVIKYKGHLNLILRHILTEKLE